MKYIALFSRATIGIFLVVLTLEFCARVDDYLTYGASPWKPYRWENVEAQDSIGAYGRPGASYQKWKINSVGYRGPELRQGTVRIATFGASETFGIYEAEDQEYPRQLQRILNSWSGGNEFEVVNVAMVGQRVAEAILRIPKTVQQVHPQFALLYPAVEHYLWLPTIKQAFDPSLANPSPLLVQVVEPPFERFEFRTVERVRNLLKQALPSYMSTWLRQLEIDRFAATHPVMDRVPEANVILFEKHIALFVADLRAAGVRPILLTHATVFGDVVSESNQYLMTAMRKSYPMLKEEGFLDLENRMNDAIRRVASHDDVLLIDAARLMPPGPRYFADGVHFTTEGSSLMASIIATALEPVIRPQPTHSNSIAQESKTVPQEIN